MEGEAQRVDRCRTCGAEDFEYIAEDVVRCRNCTFLWVRPPEGSSGAQADPPPEQHP